MPPHMREPSGADHREAVGGDAEDFGPCRFGGELRRELADPVAAGFPCPAHAGAVWCRSPGGRLGRCGRFRPVPVRQRMSCRGRAPGASFPGWQLFAAKRSMRVGTGDEVLAADARAATDIDCVDYTGACAADGTWLGGWMECVPHAPLTGSGETGTTVLRPLPEFRRRRFLFTVFFLLL